MKTWWLRGHTKEYNAIHGILKEQLESETERVPIKPPGRLPPIENPPADLYDDISGKYILF